MRIKMMTAVATAGTLLLAACAGNTVAEGDSSDSSDSSELTVLMSTVTFQYLPVLIGQDIGAFEDHGLTVKTLDVQGSSAAAQAMAAGEGDVMPISAVSVVAPILRGLEAKIVGSITNEFSSQVVVVGADSDLQGPADLKGRTIGIVQRGGLLYWLANQLAAEQGWKEGQDYELAAVGGLSEQIAALESGVTDGFIWTSDAAFQLEETGDGRALFDFGGIVSDNVNVVLAASDQAITERPEAVEGFMRGWLDTVAWMADNKAGTVEACMEHYDMSEFVCQSIYDVEMENFSRDGVIPEANLQGLAKSMVEVDEEVTEPPAISEFYDSSFVGGGS